MHATLVTRDGMRIAYYVDDFTDPWTHPETIALLHSAMSNSQRWFRMVPLLARHYRVVRMDLRGHGASQIPAPDEGFSLQHLVDDVGELLDHLGIQSAHVVGSSAGGYVAQQWAATRPARVRTLALYASTPGLKNSRAPTWLPKIQKTGLKQFLADTIADRFDQSADPDLVRWFIDQAGSNDVEFIGRFVTNMCTHDLTEDLSQIRCPTLIVAAGAETLHAASVYEDMRNRIADAQLIYYDTTGHNICDGYPERCADDLLRFLAGRR
ncbi:MAG: alpha/beta hydrolase [Casimicrobiaceae bacterium]